MMRDSKELRLGHDESILHKIIVRRESCEFQSVTQKRSRGLDFRLDWCSELVCQDDKSVPAHETERQCSHLEMIGYEVLFNYVTVCREQARSGSNQA